MGLGQGGLTANPKKGGVVKIEVQYLGLQLGHGQVHPQIDKTIEIAACPRPKTKKEVRRFLGHICEGAINADMFWQHMLPSRRYLFQAWYRDAK